MTLTRNSSVTFKYHVISYQVYQNISRLITVIISLVFPSRLIHWYFSNEKICCWECCDSRAWWIWAQNCNYSNYEKMLNRKEKVLLQETFVWPVTASKIQIPFCFLTNSEYWCSQRSEVDRLEATKLNLFLGFSYQCSPNCFIFWPAFKCCMHPKAGYLFTCFQPFLRFPV